MIQIVTLIIQLFALEGLVIQIKSNNIVPVYLTFLSPLSICRELCVLLPFFFGTKSKLFLDFAGFVYDVTPYMEYHPGGEDELMKAAGTDGTDLFDQVKMGQFIKIVSQNCIPRILSYFLKKKPVFCHFCFISKIYSLFLLGILAPFQD